MHLIFVAILVKSHLPYFTPTIAMSSACGSASS